MCREEDGRPGKIQDQLDPPELHRPAAARSAPQPPASDGDQDVKEGPGRAEDPARRGERGFVQRRIPFVGRRYHADDEAAAYDKQEEEKQAEEATGALVHENSLPEFFAGQDLSLLTSPAGHRSA